MPSSASPAVPAAWRARPMPFAWTPTLRPIPSPGRSTTVAASSAAAVRKPAPWEAIKLTEEFELAVMSKDDLTSKSVYTLEHCSRCGKPFAPPKEIDYAKRLLQKAGGMEAEQAARYRRYVARSASASSTPAPASAVKTGNAHGMAANETLASGEPQGPGMEYLGGHGVNPEYIDRELNPDAPEIPAGPAPVEGIIMDFAKRRRSNHGRNPCFARADPVPPDLIELDESIEKAKATLLKKNQALGVRLPC